MSNAPTNAIDVQGCKFLRGDGGDPEAFTQITLMRALPDLGESSDLTDVTNTDSTVREYRLKIPDGQEQTLEFIFDKTDAQQLGLDTDRKNGTVRNFRYEFSDSPVSKVDFPALVMAWSLSGPEDDVVTLSVTVKPVGPLVATWT